MLQVLVNKNAGRKVRYRLLEEFGQTDWEGEGVMSGLVSKWIGRDNGRLLASVAIVAGTAFLQACSSTAVSSYAPPGQTGPNSAAIHKGSSSYASFLARDQAIASRPQPQAFDYASIYGAVVDDGITIEAVDYTRFNPDHLRKQVRYFGPERPGTIVIDAKRRQLYLVQPDGMAIRYGIAVGKEGFGWTGNAVLQWKRPWPTWTPPKDMIARKPELAKYAEGMEGNINNPLGARAMYLFKNGQDTMYRIHGTNRPYSIGKAASSGCFRMINQDVIDLYGRVGNKGAVMVRPHVSASLVGR